MGEEKLARILQTQKPKTLPKTKARRRRQKTILNKETKQYESETQS